jgi:hypothetical protein
MHKKVAETFAELNHGRATDSQMRLLIRAMDIVIDELRCDVRAECKQRVDDVKYGEMAG